LGGNITKSGYLTKDGQEYEEVTELKRNKREVWTKEKKHFLLNKKGKIINNLSQ
jgi:hypothetical protein